MTRYDLVFGNRAGQRHDLATSVRRARAAALYAASVVVYRDGRAVVILRNGRLFRPVESVAERERFGRFETRAYTRLGMQSEKDGERK